MLAQNFLMQAILQNHFLIPTVTSQPGRHREWSSSLSCLTFSVDKENSLRPFNRINGKSRRVHMDLLVTERGHYLLSRSGLESWQVTKKKTYPKTIVLCSAG